MDVEEAAVEPGDEPGDAVCWLHELCPVCGAMPTADQLDRCWRCGHPRGAGDGGQADR